MSDAGESASPLTWGSRRARLALTATIMGSGLAFLDGSVIAVASPHIADDLGGGLATIQWVFDGYLLMLGALVLVGGSLGDLLGKRSVFIAGTAAFGVTSVLCGLAPTALILVVARMGQGAAAALVVPTSLALVNTLFGGADRGKAIGAWSGLAGVFTAVGPFVGGLLVDTGTGGWRWVFLINIPLVIGAITLALMSIPNVPGTRTSESLRSQVDVLGGLLAVGGLAFVVGPLIEIAKLGAWLTFVLVAIGLVLLALLVLVERRRERTLRPPPMVSLTLFRIRTFSVANVVTFVVYGALGSAFFLVTIALQQGMGYTAVAAGLAGIPVTVMLALFSSKVGGLLPRLGARTLLAVGPLIMAVGMVMLGMMRPGQSYWVGVLPGFMTFAAGLVLVVAPVTATALADVSANESGTASGVNNAVARIGSLIAIILLPLIGGLAASQAQGLQTGVDILDGYRTSMFAAAAICVFGAGLATVGFNRSDGRVVATEAARG